MASSEDPKVYFEQIVSFLYEYNFIFKEANTEIFTENILLKMYEKFDIKPTEKLNYNDHQIVHCENRNLRNLQEKIDYLRTTHSICMSLGDSDAEDKSARYSGFKSVPLGPKKRHEIMRMSRVVHELCLENDCNVIVDLGSGLGYLSQHLHSIYGYHVLGIESDTERVLSAIKRQEKYHKTSIGKVKYHSHTITPHSDIYLLDLLTKEFPSYDKVCLIGLHACADLTIAAMKLFLNIKNAVGLVIMPCCYHKLSLADSSYHSHEITEENKEYNDAEISQSIDGKCTEIINTEIASTKVTCRNKNRVNPSGHDDFKMKNIEQSDKESIDNMKKYSKIVTTLNSSTISANEILDDIDPTETSSQHNIQDSSSNMICTNDELEQNPQVIFKKDSIVMADHIESSIDDKIVVRTSETSSQHNIQDSITKIYGNINSGIENLKQTTCNHSTCQHFNYFPLSNALKEVMDNYKGCTFLKRPFLRLCCQPPSVDQPLDLLVFRLMSRAVLQLYAVTMDASLVKKKRRAVKRTETTSCNFDAFLTEAITNGYTLHSNHKTSDLRGELSKVTEEISDLTLLSKLTEESLVKTSKVTAGENSHLLKSSRESKPDEFIEFDRDAIQDVWRQMEKYTDMAATYILLQRVFQPICERVLLFDRIVYLRENGCLNCRFVKITDDKISPRCMALVAFK